MIDMLIKGFLNVATHLIEIVLYPIDLIIKTFLPSLDTCLTYIGSVFNYVSDFIPWVVSYLGLPQDVLEIIVSFIIFRVSLPLAVMAVKLCIKWYNALKL